MAFDFKLRGLDLGCLEVVNVSASGQSREVASALLGRAKSIALGL
jgi:hypothetical protein